MIQTDIQLYVVSTIFINDETDDSIALGDWLAKQNARISMNEILVPVLFFKEEMDYTAFKLRHGL